MYKLDLFATWMSLYEGSGLFISEISEADRPEFNKIRFLGGRQYRKTYC